jgi:nucleoside-diphosphate-sugar epimerase
VRYLVTGGGGFIGSNIAERLLHEGHEVRVLDSFATGRRSNLLDGVELIEGDVQSYERVHRATRNIDVVFHQAALPSVPRSVQDPLMSHAVNATGTLNVLLGARDNDVRRVVFASSSSVYGANPTLPKHESLVLAPISPYGVSKQAGEAYCRAFAEVYGLETVALRYFNVFGPRQDPSSQYAAVVPKFIRAALDGEPVTIHGDGTQSRDFTFVQNVVDANLLAADAEGVNGRTLNIAMGDSTTLNELVELIEEVVGRPLSVRHGPPRVGDVLHSQADVSAAREVLGYEPRFSLSDGLHETVNHLADLPAPRPTHG